MSPAVLAQVTEPPFLTVEDYLESEEAAECRHEYVGGLTYAMAGGRNEHSLIAANVLANLHAQLRGRACRVHGSDMKLRVELADKTRFYYPDLQVVCAPVARGQTFQTEPVVIVEVLSERTQRTDQVEKWEAYLSLSSLKVYALLRQDAIVATVWRRTEGKFLREQWAGLDAILPLSEIESSLALAQVYEAVEL